MRYYLVFKFISRPKWPICSVICLLSNIPLMRLWLVTLKKNHLSTIVICAYTLVKYKVKVIWGHQRSPDHTNLSAYNLQLKRDTGMEMVSLNLSRRYASIHEKHDIFRSPRDHHLMSNFYIELSRSFYIWFEFDSPWRDAHDGGKIIVISQIAETLSTTGLRTNRRIISRYCITALKLYTHLC